MSDRYYRLVVTQKVMKEARYNLERKIDKYRENKSSVSNESIVSLAEEKRRNLLKLFDDIDNEDEQKQNQSVNSSLADISRIGDTPAKRGAPTPIADVLAQQKF